MTVEDGIGTLRVDVLGPLRLTVGGTPVEVPGARRRSVLALLALAEGRTVTVDRLVDALWPTEAPASGRQALHSHVSRLRRHLGGAADRLETRPDGYRLALDVHDLDLLQARTWRHSARAAGTDAAAAFEILQAAYELWRGPVLADLDDVAPIAAAVEEVEQLRREVTDALVEAGIAAHRPEWVLAPAAAAVAEDPLREPAVLLHARALAACGRAPEALAGARAFRHRLAEETGLDASPALSELERDIARGVAGPPPPARSRPPRPSTRLAGRGGELTSLRRRLGEARLVSVVGPGGVGKTRLALELLGDDDTVLLLASLDDAAGLPHALATALGLSVSEGDVLSACLTVLGDRPRLLLVDNCEHVLAPVRSLVGQMLSACPDLTVLATSREPLGLPEEYVVRLGPLPVPLADDADLARVPSVAVFLDRAERVRPGQPASELEAVADIVRRIDGMPLAIELAAARLTTFSVADLRRRLDRSLDLFGGRPGDELRHRTLRSTCAWSYDLLDPEEQSLFRHLSVFVDGFDLAAAEWVARDLGLGTDPGAVLGRLVDTSMVVAELGGTAARYRMLETLRAYGLDRLASAGEDEPAADRLVRWGVQLCSWAGATLATEEEPEADGVLRREAANLRVVWRSARGRGRLDEAVAIISALFDAIAYRDLVEVRGWAAELADDPALSEHTRAAPVLGAAAEAAYHQGDQERATRLARAGLERATDDFGTYACLMVLCVVALARGALGEAAEHARRAGTLGLRPGESEGTEALALAYGGDLDEAQRLLARAPAAGCPTLHAWTEYVAGEIDALRGRSEEAEAHYLRAIDLARTSGATFVAGIAGVGLQSTRISAGRIDDALRGYLEVIEYFDRTGNWTHQWATLRNLADLLRRLDDPEPAARIEAAANGTDAAPSPSETMTTARAAIERHLL